MNIILAVLMLGIIIIIHELGHFLLAKKNGITVTEFSIGMGPRIASFERGGTRYSLKLLPFGGSCMMLGEDEAVEDEGSFHKKGVWARFSVIVAGALFNFILAFILAIFVLGNTGVDYPDIVEITKGSPAENAGLQPGDRIAAIGGRSIHFSDELDMHMMFHPLTGKEVDITYKRDGKRYKVSVTPAAIPYYNLGFNIDLYKDAAEVVSVSEGASFDQAGIKAGDIIREINGTKILSSLELEQYLSNHDLSGEPITVVYERDGKSETVSVTPKFVGNKYRFGFTYTTKLQKASAFETIKYSIFKVKHMILYAFDSLGYLITGKASLQDISGPVGIVNAVGQVVSEAKQYGVSTVVLSLANFCILISANLGVMNLLPLPALDGGRLVFLIIEAIRRKPVPKEKEAIVHFIGMALLMVLMVFVMFNDIRNIFR